MKRLNQDPLCRALSTDFFDAIKFNDFMKLELIVREDPFLVLDYDHIGMTGLHWACKKGYERIADILMDSHADLYATDLLRRTPLDLALKLENTHLINNLYQRLHVLKKSRMRLRNINAMSRK